MSTYYYIGCPVCRAEGPMLFADKMSGVLPAQPVEGQLIDAAEFAERHAGCLDDSDLPIGVGGLVLVSEYDEWTAER